MILIDDVREIKDFKKITFSNYKKTQVNKEFIKSLIDGKSEKVFYWCTELICSGHFLDLWENIINYMCKYIHVGNPKIPIYINNRMNTFKNIINKTNCTELELRNNMNIRKLLFEVISVLLFSQKKYCYYNIKIIDSDFNIQNLSSKLKAPNTNYSKNIFKDNDSIDLFMSINELCYHLSNDSKNSYLSIFWIEWILKYVKKLKKNKELCLIEKRNIKNIDEKYLCYPIWLIWDCLFFYADKKSKIIKSIIDSLFEIFCLKFTNSTINKRILNIYFAVYILNDNIDFKTNIITKKNVKNIDNILNNIDIFFSQVKENELKPKTNYLFNNIQMSNIDKSKEKINIINNII